MEAIKFIKQYKKEYIGEIDNSYLDNTKHNYSYYELLLNIDKNKEYLLFTIEKKENKYYLKLIDKKITDDTEYIIDKNEFKYKRNYYSKSEFNYKILMNNNKLKIKFDVNIILDYLYYPFIGYYLYIPYEYNYINKINIKNDIEYEHPYSGGNMIKEFNIFLEYMPNLTKVKVKNCNIKYGYTPILKEIDEDDMDYEYM